MEKRWFKAATILPPTVKVGGRRLLPFCLRHRIALEALGSPVVETTNELTTTQFLLAVRVLSTHDLNEVRKPWTLAEQVRLAVYNNSPRRFLRDVAKLVVYFDAQALWPRMWQKSDKAKDSALPWQLVVVASLVRNGVPLEAAWTMPESEAVWLYFANCAADGAKVELVSDLEWDAMEKYRKEKAKSAAKETDPTNPLKT